MPKLQIDPAYVNKVLAVMTSNPTSQDMDFLVEAYTTIGYYAAVANGDADLAEAERKFQEADIVAKVKESDPKASAALLEARATLGAYDYRKAEIKQRTNAKKLLNLMYGIEQAINGVKYLGRYDSSSAPVRMTG